MPIEMELAQIPELEYVGVALAQFARSLFPGADFKPEERVGRWVCDPNFVAFDVNSARSRHIRLSLRGNRGEFHEMDAMPLLRRRASSWSECIIDNPAQLFAAASYIHRAAAIYGRGPGRVHKKLIIEER